MEPEPQLVIALELQGREIRDMALQGADPALVRQDDGDRLALDQRLVEVDVGIALGLSAKVVRRLPSFVPGPNFFFTSRISQAIVFHCWRSELRSSSIWPFSTVSSSNSLRSSISSSLRRLAQARVEDRLGLQVCQVEALEALMRAGFGSSSSRMMRITSSD